MTLRSSDVGSSTKDWSLALCGFLLAASVHGIAAAADIHAAIRAGDATAVQAALADPAELNRPDTWGRTPLIVALQQGKAPLVELLVARGASVRATDAWGRTPLLVAAQLKNTAALRLLLAKGADVDAANRNDITPLIAAAQTGNTEGVTVLLAAGAAPDRADNLGWTALMWAAYRNDETTMRLLLDRDADAGWTGRDKSTALAIARSRGAGAALLALLETRANSRAPTGPGAVAAEPAKAGSQSVALRRNEHSPIDPARVVRGNPKAPITIVEYTDFQCPYCRQGAITVDEVLARYEGQVRLVVKHLPLPHLHPMAMSCALHFEALALQGADKAWGFYDRIFADPRALAGGDAYLQKVAAGLGADMVRLAQDLRGATVKERVAADLKEAEGFRFDGVPAFIVNGTVIEGAQPAQTFFAVIDGVLHQ